MTEAEMLAHMRKSVDAALTEIEAMMRPEFRQVEDGEAYDIVRRIMRKLDARADMCGND
jgi:hypothetical protein